MLLQYNFTQKDVDTDRKVVHKFEAIATFNNQIIKDTTTIVSVAEELIPGITVSLSSKQTSYSKVGDKIQYVATVTNTGNTDLVGCVIWDNTADNAVDLYDKSPFDLAVNDQHVITYEYIVTSTDVSTGYITRSIEVNGVSLYASDSYGGPGSPSDNDSLTIDIS